MSKENFKPLIISLVGIIVFCTCKQNHNSLKVIKNHGLTIKVMKMPGEPDDPGNIYYSARLVPDKGLVPEKDSAIKTALWYNMDSCFYLQSGSKKIYANIIQPIANGVSGTFEYLLSFDANELNNSKWSLVYQDKYLNHLKYRVDL